ncbi:aminopeptidase [Methanopyrus sp. KOL6]|uniref:aminopeptidase n=1 Tax=Methanopyrus sp. KOL6 TaxID=1937004 RepID=UPI000B4AA7F7|nr:aminopeptidase [Methanopyrus sp. KOL6]
MGWAERVVRECLGLSEGERFLVLTDPGMEELGRELFEAAEGTDRALVIIDPRETHGEEPPDHVAAMMRSSNAVAAVTSWSISHTEARRRACEAGARVASMPGLTRDTAERAIDVDYKRLRSLSRGLAERLTEASEARLVTPAGELVIDISGREALADDGNLRDPGEFGNLPAGEAFVAPIEGSAEGHVQIDGSVAPDGILDEPIKLEISNGRMVEASHEDLEFVRLIRRIENGEMLCELGVGTNPGAKLCGVVLEDEKVYGTVHIGFGDNSTFGGRVSSRVHLDAVIKEFELYLDDELVARSGELLGVSL